MRASRARVRRRDARRRADRELLGGRGRRPSGDWEFQQKTASSPGCIDFDWKAAYPAHMQVTHDFHCGEGGYQPRMFPRYLGAMYSSYRSYPSYFVLRTPAPFGARPFPEIVSCAAIAGLTNPLRDAMTRFDLTHEAIAEVAAKVFPSAPVVDLVPLRGGLEAAVARLTLRDEARRERHVVVKRLVSDARREAARYHALAFSGVTPSLLGAVDHGDSTWLFLERIRSVSSWPWRDSTNTRLVLEQLARVHRFGHEAAQFDDWSYEAELVSSAAETVAAAADSVKSIPELDIRRDLRPLRQVGAALGQMRKQMNAALGTTLIHGDVHTGNVILRTRAGRPEVVFLDWGRSRIGSPLEDVSSWLLSLRSWEPAAARDHDTLFRAYFAAAGRPTALTPELRDAYWFAAASNMLAGALRYQLFAARESTGKQRATAVAQARAAFRIIRRAAERLPRA